MAKWCIDYGHGGYDSGAINGIRYEKNDVKLLGDKLVALLIANGETVIKTRVNDEFISLDERCNIANRNEVNYFISLHRNSATSSSANGLETYSNKGAVNGKRLGTAIQNSILEKVPFTNRGYKEEDFRVLYKTTMTAVLIELGFIVNSKDNELFDKNIDVIVEQIAKACLKEVGKTLKKPTTPSSTGDKVTYRVVCGSFKDKANAENRCKEVQAKTGLGCFLVAEVIDGVSMYRVICGSFENKANADNRAKEVTAKTGLSCFLLAVRV